MQIIALRAQLYSQITHTLVALLDSQISTPCRLIFDTHRDDIPLTLLAEGVNRWRLLAEWGAAPEGSA
jgi:hypothetical protein